MGKYGFSKEELNNNNWLYIGQNAEIIKERKLLEIHLNKNFKDGLTPAIPIIE